MAVEVNILRFDMTGLCFFGDAASQHLVTMQICFFTRRVLKVVQKARVFDSNLLHSFCVLRFAFCRLLFLRFDLHNVIRFGARF